MSEVGCLTGGYFQNLQVEGNTVLGITSSLNKSIITTVNRTLRADESGATVIINHAAKVITLPSAEAGLHFKIILGVEATAGCNILTADATDCFFGYIPLASSDTDDQTGQAQILTTYATTIAAPASYDAMKFVAATQTIGGVAGTIIYLNCVSTIAWHVSIPGHATSDNDPGQCVLIVAR